MPPLSPLNPRRQSTALSGSTALMPGLGVGGPKARQSVSARFAPPMATPPSARSSTQGTTAVPGLWDAMMRLEADEPESEHATQRATLPAEVPHALDQEAPIQAHPASASGAEASGPAQTAAAGLSEGPARARSATEQLRAQANRMGMNLDDVAANVQRARDAGVDRTGQSLLKRCAGLLGQAVGVALFVGITVATGGTLTSFVVGAVLLTKLAADAACTAMVHADEKRAERGLPPRFNLPMGKNALANLCHAGLFFVKDPQTRQTLARGLGLTCELGLWAAGAWATQASPLLTYIAIGSNVLLTAYLQFAGGAENLNRKGVQNADGAQLQRFCDLGTRLNTLRDQTQGQPPTSAQQALLEQIEAESQQLLADVEHLAQGVERTTVMHRQNGVAREGATEGLERFAENITDYLDIDLFEAGMTLLRVVGSLQARIEASDERQAWQLRTDAHEARVATLGAHLQDLSPAELLQHHLSSRPI